MGAISYIWLSRNKAMDAYSIQSLVLSTFNSKKGVRNKQPLFQFWGNWIDLSFWLLLFCCLLDNSSLHRKTAEILRIRIVIELPAPSLFISSYTFSLSMFQWRSSLLIQPRGNQILNPMKRNPQSDCGVGLLII